MKCLRQAFRFLVETSLTEGDVSITIQYFLSDICISINAIITTHANNLKWQHPVVCINQKRFPGDRKGQQSHTLNLTIMIQ